MFLNASVQPQQLTVSLTEASFEHLALQSSAERDTSNYLTHGSQAVFAWETKAKHPRPSSLLQKSQFTVCRQGQGRNVSELREGLPGHSWSQEVSL